MSAVDAACDAALAYAIATGEALIFGQWDNLDQAHAQLAAAVQDLAMQAFATKSGAADEVEFYADPPTPRERRKGWWFA
jgi:hypothetical protein